MARAASQGEPANARRRNDATGDGEPVGVGRKVDFAPRAPAFDVGSSCVGIDEDPPHLERSTTTPSSQTPRPPALCPPPRTAMHPVDGSNLHGLPDVGVVGTTNDRGRPTIDHRIVDFARRAVSDRQGRRRGRAGSLRDARRGAPFELTAPRRKPLQLECRAPRETSAP